MTTTIRVISLLLIWPLLTSSWAADVPSASWWPKAAPLPQPQGTVVRVQNVDELFRAVREVPPGATILVADGHYLLPKFLDIRTDNVTLRSESGHRDQVVLDGQQSNHGELVGVSNCEGVTIADLTIQNIKWNGFKINSNKYATKVTIRNCVIHNVWQRGVKGPAVDEADRGTFWPTDCRIEFCLFYNDRPKRFSDDPADTAKNFGGNYIGGIDAMYARRWVIADNVFLNIHGRTGEGRGAIFLWNHSQECVVERNIIIDCDCGICLGNHSRHRDARWHDWKCIVRNNFVTRCTETGILAAHTRECQILHNTVFDPQSRLRRLVWIQDDNDGLLVGNNLLCGPEVRDTGSSAVSKVGNVTGEQWKSVFVDPQGGNLRLQRAGVPLCPRIDQADSDIDGQPRPARTMAGADHYHQD